MKNNKVINFIKTNCVWLICFAFLLFSFVALSTPILSVNYTEINVIDGSYVFTNNLERSKINLASIINSKTYVPLLIFYLLIIVAISFLILGRKNKNFYLASTLILLCDGIFFFTLNIFYDLAFCISGVNDPNLIEEFGQYSNTKLAFGAIFAGVLCFVCSLISFILANESNHITIKDMAEIAMFSALAIALQFIKIPIGATGGSINLGLIPLFLVSLRHGPTKGFLASAIIYGLITCLSDGYGFNTYPFDYLLGFGGCSVMGFFSKLCFKEEKGYSLFGFIFIAIGVVIGSLIRIIGSTASSIINYGYSFKAAFGYNVIYVSITGGVSLLAMEALYIPLAKLNKLFPVSVNS